MFHNMTSVSSMYTLMCRTKQSNTVPDEDVGRFIRLYNGSISRISSSIILYFN